MGIRSVLFVLACFLFTACTGDPVVIDETASTEPPAASNAEQAADDAAAAATDDAAEQSADPGTDGGADNTTGAPPPDATATAEPPPPSPTDEPPTPTPTATPGTSEPEPVPALRTTGTIAASFAGSGSELWAVTPTESRYVADVTATGLPVVLTDITWSGEGDLFGITFDELYRVNPETGEARLVGPLGNGSANALERGPEGQLFAATTAGEFLSIDPGSGRSELIGPLGPGFVSSGDLAFSPDGRLLASVKRAAGEDGLGVEEPLSEDDRATGSPPEIALASFGQSAPSDLLIEVDPRTGLAVEVVAELPLDVWGLTFIDNMLYGLGAISVDRCPTGSIFPIGDESRDAIVCLGFQPGGATNG